MDLPIPTSMSAMEALTAETLPEGDGWAYEPKWDGFRCLAFRDGDDVELRSKANKPLQRYFPDVVAALAGLGARRFVLDGEIVIPHEDRLSFEQLLMRIHPAASRVHKLAQATPAVFVAFDLLLSNRGGPVAVLPLRERRSRLESFAARHFHDRVRLSPQTTDPGEARRWLAGGQDGLDGVMAKRLDEPYRAGERAGMVKVKRLRTADCVVGGFRYGSNEELAGSLLLGLFDGDGLLDHVGFTSTISNAEREELTRRLEKLKGPPGFTGNAPGGPSRWSTKRSGQWEPLKHELVVEVRYDHVTDRRFRHGTKLVRWRPDKAPRQCTFDQIESEARPGKLIETVIGG
jgi:ATP-dependent DNA ligase